MGSLLQDVRYALRQLRKSPWFTVVAVLTLALGIGATTAVFSAIRVLLLNRFPYPEPDQIVHVWSKAPHKPLSTGDFLDLREQSKSFAELGAYKTQEFNLGGEQPQAITGIACTAGVLRTFGIRPVLGRWLEPADEETGAAPVVVLSHALWLRRFSGDPGAIGKTLRVNGTSATVVGVMPADFEFQSPWFSGKEFEIFGPLMLDRNDPFLRSSNGLLSIGRLKPGVSLKSADAETRAIGARLAQMYPENRQKGFLARSLQEEMSAEETTRLWTLLSAAAVVLLVACANVAGMLLTRGVRRQTEFGVRLALGATRLRIVRLLLAEGVALAALAAVVGTALALGNIRLLQTLVPMPMARAAAMRLDPLVLTFSVALALFAVLLFAVPPAIAAARSTASDSIREGAHGGHKRTRLLWGMVTVQIAAGLLLANVATLLTLSYRNVLNTNREIDTEYVLTARIALRGDSYRENADRLRLMDQVVERVRSLPGVTSAAVTSKLPLEGGSNSEFLFENDVYDPSISRPLIEESYVSPGYFGTMGLPILVGRGFEKADQFSEPKPVVVNRTLAETFWPGKAPLGRIIRRNGPEPSTLYRVVGVVQGVRQRGAEKPAQPEIYFPSDGASYQRVNLVIRSAKDAHAFAPLLQRELSALDRDLPLANVRTMKEVVSASVSDRRAQMLLIVLLTLTALGLAALGVYGCLSYQVLQRTREIGLRLALGASRGNVIGFVFRRAAVWVSAGLGTGLLATFGLSSLLRSLVYGVRPLSSGALLAGMGLTMAAATLACLLPARRASKVPPAEALRCQ
jgi:predicted permease